MPGNDPQSGDVYYYPYLWKRQGPVGRPEKDRPCCVAIRLTKGKFRGADVFLLALTQSGVPQGGFGQLVPPDLIANLNRLDSKSETHVILSEFNADRADQPSFADREYLGQLPKSFMMPLIRALIEHIKSGGGEVNRSND